MLRWGSRGISGGGSVGRPTALQAAPDRDGVGQCGDQEQAASTGGTDGDIERKDARQ